MTHANRHSTKTQSTYMLIEVTRRENGIEQNGNLLRNALQCPQTQTHTYIQPLDQSKLRQKRFREPTHSLTPARTPSSSTLGVYIESKQSSKHTHTHTPYTASKELIRTASETAPKATAYIQVRTHTLIRRIDPVKRVIENTHARLYSIETNVNCVKTAQRAHG